MSYHIEIVIHGKIDWQACRYQAVLAIPNRRSQVVTLAQAIDYCRRALIMHKKCWVEEISETPQSEETTQQSLFKETDNVKE